MTTPVAVRRVYKIVVVPETYSAGWLRMQLGYISRAIWTPVSRAVFGHDTIVGADDCVFVDATDGPVSITIPAAAQMQFARVTIKKIDASANAVTLAGTIDGVVNPTLATQYKSKTIQSDGIHWYTLATV